MFHAGHGGWVFIVHLLGGDGSLDSGAHQSVPEWDRAEAVSVKAALKSLLLWWLIFLSGYNFLLSSHSSRLVDFSRLDIEPSATTERLPSITSDTK